MSFTPLRSLKVLITVTALCGVAATGCEELEEDCLEEQQTLRPGTIGDFTFNTSNWVSAASRDIYEFDRSGVWRSNGYGFENKLDEITFEHPELGVITTNPGAPVQQGAPRVELTTTGMFEIMVFRPGEPPESFCGAELVGLELGFQTRYNGGPQYATKVRVINFKTDPAGGQMFDIHKVNLQNNELLAPICETSSKGDRFARVYDHLSINVNTGAATDTPDVFHLACTASAPGKSALYGYLPDQRDEFLLANRVIRADYCADGHPYTFPGNALVIRDNFSPGQEGATLADVYDYAAAEGLALEAMWDERGIICVDTPRVESLTRLDVLCPIKRQHGEEIHNWRPPSCEGFVDMSSPGMRFFSLTAPSE